MPCVESSFYLPLIIYSPIPATRTMAIGKIEAFFKIIARLELNRFRGKYNKAKRHGGSG